MGIPGLLLSGAWAALAARAAWAARRNGSAAAAALGAALIASVVASLFSAASLGPLLASLLALAMLVAASPSEPATEIHPFRVARAFAPAFAAAFIAFAGWLGVYEFRLHRFSLHPDEAAYRATARASLPGAADDLFASRMLQLQCQKRTDVASYAGCIQQTLQAAARALYTDDDLSNAWYNIAMLSAAQRDLEGTRRGLVAASKASPNWFKPHWTLANLLSQTGETAEAKAQASRAAYLDSNRDPEVVETLAKLARD
jgi:hypothetical protein